MKLRTILFLLACLPVFLVAASENAPSETVLEEKEKEFSHLLVQEYIYYAIQHPLHAVPVVMNFRNYLYTTPDPDIPVRTVAILPVDSVAPYNDLLHAWKRHNELNRAVTLLYLSDREATALEGKYRNGKIKDERYQHLKLRIKGRMCMENPLMRKLRTEYTYEFLIARRESLVFILDDYIGLDKAIPTEWIPEQIRQTLIMRNSDLRKMNREIKQLRQAAGYATE